MLSTVKIRPRVLGLTVILLALIWVWCQADQWYTTRLQVKQEKKASDFLAPRANALTAAISRRLSLVDALEAFVKIHPDKKSIRNEFEVFAEGLYANGAGIRAIQVYPDGISQFIYPLKGNEGLIGRNLLQDDRPEVQKDVQRALRTDGITLGGPLILRQGGLGLIARKAVRLHGRFWGFVNVVMDVPPILKEAGISPGVQDHINLILEDHYGKVFHGRPELLARRISVETLALPEGRWKLSVVPDCQWIADFSREQMNFRLMLSCLLGLIFVIAYLFLTRQERLVQVVADRTRDLSAANEALEKDILERKAVEKSLVESEERYRLLVEQASDGIFVTDAMGRYIEVNQMACEMLGYSRKELLSMGITDLIHPDEVARGVEDFSTLNDKENHRFELRLKKKDSSYILTDISARMIGENRYLGIVRDITERVRNEQQLNAFIDSPFIGRVVTDSQFRCVRVNSEFVEGFATSYGDLSGKRLEDVNPIVGEELRTICRRIFEDGQAITNVEFQTEEPRNPGNYRYWISAHFPILGVDGKAENVGSVFLDITKNKKSEENMKRFAEELEKRVMERTRELEAANKELESFSFSVSHDLRAPLRGISGFSQVLLEDYAERLDETGRDFLNRIYQAGIRMGGLIDDMLKLSRLNQSELSPREVNLSELVESIAAELGEAQPDREVEWLITPDVRVKGDERLIRIALENLLGNAWKFTGGVRKTEIEFGFLDREGETVYFVRDNGAGFDMAFVGKLFTPFQRLHSAKEFAGNGIGLATVQRVIRRHGGRIWAESTVQQGSTFYFTLKL